MILRIYRLRPGELLFSLLFIFIIFGDYLSDAVYSGVSYADDLMMILILMIAVFILLKRPDRLTKKEYRMVLILSVIYIVGVAGNLVTEYQSSVFAILVDMLGWLKFFGAYICFSIIIRAKKTGRYLDISVFISKMVLLFGMVLAILNLFSVINLTEGFDRFGFHSFSFGGHPSSALAIFVSMVCLLDYHEKKNRVWIMVALILSVLTFRFKAIAFVPFFIYVRFFLKKKFSLWKILIAGAGLIFIVWDQIEYYFGQSTATRSYLLSTAVEIAKDQFPIGSGFASFGTIMSGQYTSEAYAVYGLSSRFGISNGNYSRIGDGGIASVIGQFGFIGTILMILLLIVLLKSVLEHIRMRGNIVPYITIIGYLIISQTNEGAFNSSYALLFAFVLALLVRAWEYDSSMEALSQESSWRFCNFKS